MKTVTLALTNLFVYMKAQLKYESIIIDSTHCTVSLLLKCISVLAIFFGIARGQSWSGAAFLKSWSGAVILKVEVEQSFQKLKWSSIFHDRAKWVVDFWQS